MDYETYRQWYLFNTGRDPGQHTGLDPSQWARDAWSGGGQDAYRQQISPYLGKELQSRDFTMDMGEGQSQTFKEFQDPVTGMWHRSAEWADPNRTSYTFGTGGVAGETGAAETSNGQHWLTPTFTASQKDGKWFLDDGRFGIEKDQKNKETMTGLAAVALGGLGLNYLFPGAPGAAEAAAGGAGAGWAEAGAAEAALGQSILDAAPIGAGVGGASTIPGAGWAEMGAAESALGSSILDAAPVGAGATTTTGGLLGSGISGASKYIPGLLGAIAGGTSKAPGQGSRELDPRVAEAIFGQGGGLEFARGLLSMPVAPNGFSRFYPG